MPITLRPGDRGPRGSRGRARGYKNGSDVNPSAKVCPRPTSEEARHDPSVTASDLTGASRNGRRDPGPLAALQPLGTVLGRHSRASGVQSLPPAQATGLRRHCEMHSFDALTSTHTHSLRLHTWMRTPKHVHTGPVSTHTGARSQRHTCSREHTDIPRHIQISPIYTHRDTPGLQMYTHPPMLTHRTHTHRRAHRSPHADTHTYPWIYRFTHRHTHT